MFHKMNQEKYALAIKELLETPCTAHHIAEATEVHTVTAQNLMRTFLRHKIVHVSAWDPDSRGRDVTPVYSVGPGKNAKRRKKTAAERQQQHRNKKKMAAIVALRPQIIPDYIPEIV